MAVKTIVVGVDGSPSSIEAARTAWDLAERAKAACHLVHVATDVPYLPAWPIETSPDDMQEIVTAHAREAITTALEHELPAAVLEHLEIEMGSAAWTLPKVADRYEADLVVLGGKHHAGPVRLLGGSVAHHLVRTLDRSVLVTDPDHLPIQHVTAAVDLAAGSVRVLLEAAQIADLTGASLRVIHAIEPLPPLPGSDLVFDHAKYEAWSRGAFDDLVTTHTPKADRLIVVGRAEEAVNSALEQSPTDVLTVGSHGKGFVDRALIGSVTHRLLTTLPTSLLVIPLGEDARAAREQQNRAA